MSDEPDLNDSGRTETTVRQFDAEVTRSVYGDASGRWLLLTTPVGLVCPPYVDVAEAGKIIRLQDLGPLSDVLTQIHNAHRGGGRPVQQALAHILGVTQQQVSSITNGHADPRLRPESWANLVRAWFAPELVEAAIARLAATDQPAPTSEEVAGG